MPFDLDDDEYRATRILTGADKPDEIKVGEYVRIKSGYIAKVLGKRGKHSFTTTTGHKANYQERYFIDNDKYSISKPYIKKHSKNIIDLIEVGDIVKYKELTIDEKYNTIVNEIYVGNIHTEQELEFLKEEIQRKGLELLSIVTKEQFASMEYKIGG